MTTKYYIFAGGGTGGHIYPGLAVAEELVKLQPEAKIVFACSDRDIDRRILGCLDYGCVPQPVRPLPNRPWKVAGFLKAWIKSSRQARDMIRDIKPTAVLGLGGFASGPVVKQACKHNLKTAMLNPDAVPGKANLHLSKYVQKVFTQFDATKKLFASSVQGKVQTVGCPVRSDFFTGQREIALDHFGLRQDRKTLLVNGGSLGAASINEAVMELTDELDELSGSWQLLHITGPSSFSRADRETKDKMHTVRIGYCDRMDLAYCAADLALCRCGASTAAELAISHTPSIIMPYPYHRDMHQLKNADELVNAQAALICMDTTDPVRNGENLEVDLLGLMKDTQRLDEMVQNAMKVAKKEAAQTVARWLAEAN